MTICKLPIMVIGQLAIYHHCPLQWQSSSQNIQEKHTEVCNWTTLLLNVNATENASLEKFVSDCVKTLVTTGTG